MTNYHSIAQRLTPVSHSQLIMVENVISGRDFPMHDDGCTLPPHASRFWLYAGADTAACQSVAATLALHWRLAWRDPSRQAVQEEVA